MGKLIVIDGLDGSGKGTQTEILYQSLVAAGFAVRMVSFPQYGTPGAVPLELYLGGKLGQDPGATNAYAASTLFAVDRYLSFRTDWGDFLGQNDTVLLANRYTTANAVHQLSKMKREMWDVFLAWLWDFEFAKLGLPKPDLVLYLEMTPEISHRLVDRRSDETGQKKDIHELDQTHLERSYQAALYASEKLGWHKIKCYEASNPLTREDIAAKIRPVVDTLLKN